MQGQIGLLCALELCYIHSEVIARLEGKEKDLREVKREEERRHDTVSPLAALSLWVWPSFSVHSSGYSVCLCWCVQVLNLPCCCSGTRQQHVLCKFLISCTFGHRWPNMQCNATVCISVCALNTSLSWRRPRIVTVLWHCTPTSLIASV